MRQQKTDKKQSKVQIKQHAQKRINLFIKTDLQEERLKLEARGQKQKAAGEEQENLRILLQDREGQIIIRQEDLDEHQESLESWQEELEGIQRCCGAEDGHWGITKSVIIIFLCFLLVLVLVI